MLLSSLRDPERLKPWLLTVTANVARQAARHRHRHAAAARGGNEARAPAARIATGVPPRSRSADSLRRRTGPDLGLAPPSVQEGARIKPGQQVLPVLSWELLMLGTPRGDACPTMDFARCRFPQYG